MLNTPIAALDRTDALSGPHDPFGLLLVTPRVRPLELSEAAKLGALELVDLFTLPTEFVPGDPSRSRVGVLNGHFVITDCLDQHAEAPQQR